MKTTITASVLALGLFSGSVLADALTGKISFSKKAPYVGVLYAKTGTGPTAAQVDQKDKVFDKKIVVVGNGGKIQFKNSDSFDHNIFANDPKTNVQFDVGLMPPGQVSSVTADWKTETLTRIGCKIHPKMRSYIANLPSDTYQIIEFQRKVKQYDIQLDVADTQSQFVFTMPKYDPIEVSIAKGESKTVELTKKGKPRGTITLSRN